MPELPEVETVKKGLEKSITDKRIDSVLLRCHGLRKPFPENLPQNLKNKIIQSVTRRGKYILCLLDNGASIVLHLGMSGRISVHEPGNYQEPKKHDHMIINFSDQNVLCFNDPRRFGLVEYIMGDPIAHKIFKKMGAEPFSDEFNPDYLYDKLHKKSVNIKNALLDQAVVAGLGNIYVCEALFESKILPTRKCHDISGSECEKLVKVILNVLNKAIIAGGSTLKDYKNIDGDSGYFQHSFSVYGKEGQSCLICKAQNQNCSIKRIVQSGRSSFYCDKVQK